MSGPDGTPDRGTARHRPPRPGDPRHAGSRHGGSRSRRIGGWGALVAAAGTGAWALLGFPTARDAAPRGEPRVVEVEMEMTGFEPPEIRVRAGEPFVLRLHTPESAFDFEGPTHQLAIDELGVDLRIGGGETAETTVTVAEPGRYEFYCDLCCSGQANPSMVGELIVSG